MSEGRKDDNDKPRYDLLPPEALDALARVLTFGAEKYEDRNWEKGMRWGRTYAALQRHLWAWWGGENTDSETGESHLAHAMCCVAFLLTYEARGMGEDDRPASPKIAAAFKSRRTVSGAGMTLEERQAMVGDMNRRQRAMEGRTRGSHRMNQPLDPEAQAAKDERDACRRESVKKEPDVLDDVSTHYRNMETQREAKTERDAALRREIEEEHMLRVK